MKDRKTIRTAMTLILALAVCIIPICVPAETFAEPEIITFSTTGVEMELPAVFAEAEGVITPTYDFEVSDGIRIAGLTYYAFTADKYNELAAKSELTDAEIEFINEHVADIVWVFCIDGGKTTDDIREVMESFGYELNELRETGTAGKYRFYICAGPDAYIVLRFDAKYRKEYNGLVKACDETEWMRFIEPEPEKPLTADDGSAVVFETVDLAGNPVKSSELFSQYELTMVNLWGTFCGPCKQEMPGLEELNQMMKERNIAVIGVVVDIAGPNDTELIEEAEEIIARTGVTYPNLLPWDGIDAAMPSMYIPTTYFVDSQGHIVGEAAVGARGPGAYETLIEETLERIGK